MILGLGTSSGQKHAGGGAYGGQPIDVSFPSSLSESNAKKVLRRGLRRKNPSLDES